MLSVKIPFSHTVGRWHEPNSEYKTLLPVETNIEDHTLEFHKTNMNIARRDARRMRAYMIHLEKGHAPRPFLPQVFVSLSDLEDREELMIDNYNKACSMSLPQETSTSKHFTRSALWNAHNEIFPVHK